MWFLFIFFLLASHCFSMEVNFHDFDAFQNKLSKDYVIEKIANDLEYSPEIKQYFQVGEEALLLFASPEDKDKGIVEYQLFFGEETPHSPEFKLNKPLSQAKIAIDPGHFGGDLARLEEQYVEMNHEGEMLFFDEGSLSFLTALHLKKKLEEEGASVFLTRQSIGKGAYPENFFDWLKGHPEHWKKGGSLSTIFLRHYNRLDLRERAKIINAYHPDLTIIIHYNAIDSEQKNSQETKESKRNFNLVFIPGAFCKGELASPEDRYHFLRLLCSDDLESSFHIAHKLIETFTTHLQVSPLKSSKRKVSGFSNALISESGIFRRNLCLTRLVKGPLCYGETLIQNNLQEALALSKKETSIEGIPCSTRVVTVAEAYFEAISSFYISSKQEKSLQESP